MSASKESNSQNVDAAELIVELYSEEIPWRMQEPMAQNLAKLLQAELLSALGLSKGGAPQKNDAASGAESKSGGVFGELHLYWTPRRVAVALTGVPKKSRAWKEKMKGPRVASPQVAIDGFMRKNNIGSIGECVKVKDAKGEYYALEVEHLAVATSEVLGAVVATVINKMQKELKISMRFADQSFRWVRPLRHILVVFDGTGVQGSIGLGNELGNELDNDEKLDFTDKTRGHPFGSADPLAVASVADYESKLRANHVEPIYAKRLAIIKKTVGEVIEFLNNSQQAVIEENACLSECPAVLTGHFDEEFLSALPLILIEVVLNQHQKIICDAKDMKQRCGFYFVANVSSATDKDRVIRGVERVVRARLADAKFMLERDMKIPNAEHIKRLEHITFHPKLGSIADKNARVKKLLPIIINELKKHKDNSGIPENYDCTLFAKEVDDNTMSLATETVREFPKLQVMISNILKQPIGYKFDCARITSLANAIDSLVSLFLAGERATGSGDPFFLRRYALEIIDCVIRAHPDNYYLSLSVIFTAAKEIINSQRTDASKSIEERWESDSSIETIPFMLARLRQWMSDFQKHLMANRWEAARADCIEAILTSQESIRYCNILEMFDRIKTLQEELEKSNHLAEIFRRLHAMLHGNPIKYFLLGSMEELEEKFEKDTDLPEPKLFEKPEERALYTIAKDIIMEGKAWDELSYKQKLIKLADLKSVIDAFFDKVMVIVEDKAIRKNRRILLYRIYRRFVQLANFHKIQHKDLQQQSRLKQAN